MVSLSLAEQVTQSFYAWELRGRGWQCASAPVSLEPVFRPFFLLPQHAPLIGRSAGRIDDGKRPTLFSAVIDGIGHLFTGHADAHQPATPFEEQEPFPALPRSGLVTYGIRLPEDWKADPTVAAQLLIALSTVLEPVGFEWIGTAGRVELQLVCDAMDAERVTGVLAAYCPDASITLGEDRLLAAWNTEDVRFVLDAGLANEFFLPIAGMRTLAVDPLITLIAALAEVKGRGECAVFQVLFERVRNPWADATRDAFSDGDGGCIFADAPEFPALAREKIETPLFAVVVRIGAAAASVERVWELARGVGGFLLQFARPGSNEIVPLENDAYPEERRELDLLERSSCRTGMLLSARELLGLVHLPDASVRHPALLREVKRTKAPPPETHCAGVLLGENIHRGAQTPVSLPLADRLQHVHIVGASGTGKSTLLVNMVLQDIAEGIGVAVLDPHGDMIDDIVTRVPDERLDDVILFDPSDEEYPIGFNILSAGSDRERTLLASDLVSVFERLSTSWGDTMSTVLGNAVLAMLESAACGTLRDLRRFLIDDGFRKSVLATVSDEEVRFFWEREFALIGTRSIGPLLSRLDAFLRSKLVRAIVGQRDARLDLARVMDGGAVFLAKLSQGLIGEANAALLGSLLVSKFHQLALGRQAQAKGSRRPFFLYADECQHFVTASMGALLAEGRKYGLGLTLAHQGLAQLEHAGPAIRSAILGAHTRIVFRVGSDDARALAGGYAFFEAPDLERLGKGEAIARVGSAAHDFNLRTFPAETVPDDVAAERQARVVEQSRTTYAVPLAELRARFAEEYGPRDEPPPPRRDTSVPKSVQEEVTTPESAPAPEPARDEMEAEEGIRVPVVLPPPAPRVRRAKPPLPVEPAPLGRGGAEHKYLQHLIKRLGEERGFRAVIEEPVEDGRVDIVLRRETLAIACEISVTTDVAHEIANLRKCLAGGYTHLLFVCQDKRRRERIAREWKKVEEDRPVSFVAPDEIVPVLDSYAAPAAMESTVRGYKVKVTRQAMSPEDVAGKRAAIAGVIARSLGKARATE